MYWDINKECGTTEVGPMTLDRSIVAICLGLGLGGGGRRRLAGGGGLTRCQLLFETTAVGCGEVSSFFHFAIFLTLVFGKYGAVNGVYNLNV